MTDKLENIIAIATRNRHFAFIEKFITSGKCEYRDIPRSIAALISENTIHDVVCRCGMASIIASWITLCDANKKGSPRIGGKGKALFKRAEFAEAYNYAIENCLIDFDGAQRLVRMGARPIMLVKPVVRYSPEWTDAFLRITLTPTKTQYQTDEWRLPYLAESSHYPSRIVVV